MRETEANELVKNMLSEERYAHTLRVMETAEALALQYGANVGKVRLAALLHDYAKCFSIEKLKGAILNYHLPKSLLDYHHELWHAPVASRIMEEEFHIQDEDILHAICYHTTGHPEMTLLAYIIFVADYIEPARDFSGVEMVRELAISDIKLAARQALKNTITYLMLKDNIIHPDSFKTYNYLTEITKERSIVEGK